MEQLSQDAAKANAFANGLRKSIAATSRRWSQFPRGASDLELVLSRIDRIQQRLAGVTADDGAPIVAAAIADLRAILEWSTYQSASIAAARAVQVARKTRSFAGRLGLVDDPETSLPQLTKSEDALIENVQIKNDYMLAIAAKNPHLGFPAPLVTMESLATPPAKAAPGKLDLIQQLMKTRKKR